jgi:phospholipid transport system substrate-binding protein
MAKHHARLIWTLIALFTFCSVHGAWAGPPTDQLREGVDRVIKILQDPDLKGDKYLDQRRAAIALAARAIFDFGEMARRSLAQHWERRTPTEQEEFVRIFTALIERSYISKVDQNDVARWMTYRGETVDADYAVVQTTVTLNNGRELALDYRMHNPRDRWRVYDLSIDGTSMVANYRAQFNKVIRTSSYEALVARIKSNQAQAGYSAPTAASAGTGAAR